MFDIMIHRESIHEEEEEEEEHLTVCFYAAQKTKSGYMAHFFRAGDAWFCVPWHEFMSQPLCEQVQ